MRRTFIIVVTWFIVSAPLLGQSRAYGRLTLFGMTQRSTYEDGVNRTFDEVTGSLTLRSADAPGFEYAFDARGSVYPSAEGRSSQGTLYDAWGGYRSPAGGLRIRAGQMWLNELGGIGSVGGVSVESRIHAGSDGRGVRFGFFGGLEPKTFEAGYVSSVHKGGAWAAIDGDHNRRHVIGYVLIRNSGLTERSVITTTNFIPAGRRLFIYQLAELDLRGPGGKGSGGLNFVFANARYTPSDLLEVMADYHRGRSIDTRTITQEILDGRPIDQKQLDGFRYESGGGRVTVQPLRGLRFYAGYAQDRNNVDDKAAGRVTVGMWASNVARSGFDVTISDNRTNATGRRYNAWYASLGRNFGPRLYASVDYSTSLSVIRILGSDGLFVDSRPRTKRFSVNGVWNLSRIMSITFTAEELRDGTVKDNRTLIGSAFRF